MADNGYVIGVPIVEKFSLINPTTGNRVTSSAVFQPLARDPNGADISSQITVTADGTSAGIYTYTFTPTIPGVYIVSIYETTTKAYVDSVYRVGGSVFDRIMNLANKGQDISIGAGSGGLSYSNTVTLAGVPQAGVVVYAYKAQDALAPDQSAIVDLQTVIAKTTTAGDGSFTLQLTTGYFALHYNVGGLFYQSYVRWSTLNSQWVTSTDPIPPS